MSEEYCPEIPQGWEVLYSQMMEDIAALGFEDFKWLQVKEKYGEMRCYTMEDHEEVADIITKYEVMASFICAKCGKPAVVRARGYMLPYCEGCYDSLGYDGTEPPIWFRTEIVIRNLGDMTTRTLDFGDEWERYLERIGHDK